MDVTVSVLDLIVKKLLRCFTRQNKFLSDSAYLFDIPSDDEIHLKVGILLVQLAKYYSWWRE